MSKHFEMLPEEAFQRVGKSMKLYKKGGGGGGNQTSTGTTYTTNIPEYARPYVETMLGATEKQLFNMDSSGNITGFQPYVPYSSNPENYVAGFSPLQKAAQQQAAGLQVPGQFGAATQMAGASGLGSLGLAGQAANAGQQFQQMATNPAAMQAYMNPYLQASLTPQIEAMRREYGKTATEQQGRATAAGAFGGSREALMAAENERAKNAAIDAAIGQGYNTAFQNAQQQQQFGANLGLQGLSTGLSGLGQAGQAASTLGSLGQQQLAAQQGVIGTQAQMGAQQQAQQQQIINQAIQDYANAQQYPMMQLGLMSNMLRGLPMQGVTTETYQAQPNVITQGIGALGTGYALQNAMGGTSKAEGGTVKSYAKGGIASYDVGGEVKNDLYDYPAEKLEEISKSSQSETVRGLARSILREKTGMAAGGIIAFDEGGLADRALRGLEALTPLGAIRTVSEVAKEEESKKDAERMVNAGYSGAETVADAAAKGETGLIEKLKGFGAGLNPFDVPKVQAPAPAPAAKSADQTRIDKTKAFLEADAKRQLAQPKEDKPAKTAVDIAKAQVEAREEAKKKVKVADEPPRINAQPDQQVPSETTTAKGIIDAMDPAAKKYFSAAPTQEDTAAIAERIRKEKEAFLGPDTANAEYRKKIMAERANADDEARRQESMRMAEFFSTWGSTPGDTLVAGMKAAKETIPNLIADKKERTKANRELDKIIRDLDQADRLEKKGMWEEATKIKEDQAKNMQNWVKSYTDVYNTAATNKTRLEAEQMGNISAEKIAKGKNATDLQVAGMRSGEANTTKQLALAQKADAHLDEVKNKIAANRNGKEYTTLVQQAKNADMVDPSNKMYPVYQKAKQDLAKWHADEETRISQAEKTRNAFWKQTGFDTGESSAPAGKTVDFSKLPK